MPSEKLTRILKAKSNLSDEEIKQLSEAEGWDWVYSNAKPKKEKLTQVCFTGFNSEEKATLTRMAEEKNLQVTSTVTKSLAFLCCGSNAGEAKIKKAKSQDCVILNRTEFEILLETGELPMETTE
ncbi:MAG: hypothetical protein ACO3B3_09880 [Cyanobium sp.]